MRGLILRSLLALWIATTPGCMTIISQDTYWNGLGDNWKFLTLPRLWIYGGAVNDACGIGAVWNSPAVILCLLDLPLSFAADTLLLPLTVYQQITYTPPEKPPEEEGADPESGEGAGEGKTRHGLRP